MAHCVENILTQTPYSTTTGMKEIVDLYQEMPRHERETVTQQAIENTINKYDLRRSEYTLEIMDLSDQVRENEYSKIVRMINNQYGLLEQKEKDDNIFYIHLLCEIQEIPY
ncbi:unnamed protein product [Caenorhabditis angaria]|uniref:Uncharacterized protein n=1 Tax=Caenorhabditis angaria TaxID=860376 RepID=A0A9P1IBQ2_9PELO|nr:unnamed protein product [Caenorhabditis angaria]